MKGEAGLLRDMKAEWELEILSYAKMDPQTRYGCNS